MALNLQLFQDIVEYIDDGVIVVDKNMRIVYWNKWIEQRSKKNSDYIVGKNLEDIFPDMHNSRLSSAIQDTINEFAPQFMSNLFHKSPIALYPAISAFGRTESMPLQLDINTIPIKYESANACIIQIRDVSFSSRRETALEHEIVNRATIERHLRENESRYRLLAENTSDIIIQTDTNLVISYISPNCVTHLEIEDLEFDNTNIFTYTHKDDIEILKSILQNNPADSKSLIVRHRIKNNAEKYQWFESTIKSYTSETHPKNGYVFVTRNIEDRIKEEEYRSRMQKQFDRNQRMQAIGQLTGGIAHKFNNMLTSIMGYTDLSYALTVPINSDTLHNYLNEINNSSQRSKKLVVRLLEYSQEKPIQLMPTDVSNTIKNAIVLINASLPSNMVIELATQDGLENVNSNNIQLEQILLNLCMNSMDAMDKNGIIYINIRQENFPLTTCQSCHEQFNGDYISIEVKDTGIGIGSDEIESIFQPFFTSKGRATSTGLGLSVVHGIVHSQTGHILVDSDVSGTSVRILLPIIPH
ncbi:MAG: ATP-binding protein [Gammaproteobacteria bacterium]|nr:ATP-binding protein [Gammaproteobacteria bacterium]